MKSFRGVNRRVPGEPGGGSGGLFRAKVIGFWNNGTCPRACAQDLVGRLACAHAAANVHALMFRPLQDRAMIQGTLGIYMRVPGDDIPVAGFDRYVSA